MTLDFFGIANEYDDVATEIGYLPGEGTDLQDMLRYLRRNNLQVRKMKSHTDQDLHRVLVERDGLILLSSIPRKNAHVSLLFQYFEEDCYGVANHHIFQRSLSQKGFKRLIGKGEFSMHSIIRRW